MGLFELPRPSILLLVVILCLESQNASSFQPPTTRLLNNAVVTRHSQQLYSSKKDENMSASGKERRDEDTRRQVRKTDVVIGKTSAVVGAKDYPINSKNTQETWMQQASNLEQRVYRHTEIGMEMLKMFRLEESVAAFDQVFELKSNAYCWQAGIAKYYLGDLVGAAEIFRDSANIYESKFGVPASEERIWRDACELKYISGLNKKSREAMNANGGVEEVIPQARVFDPMSDSPIESRRVFRITKDLFCASVGDDAVNLVLSRAKLRSICGAFEANPRVDRKMWKLNSWFYLGLHYDSLGQEVESKECMKMALRMCPNSKGEDIIHSLPMLHMSRRDWFDDDDYEEIKEAPAAARGESIEVPLGVKTDPIIIESLHDSISKLKHHGLKEALKARGLMHSGSKEELRMRLFNSLVTDAGLQL